MAEHSDNTKRLAKNTLMLYARMVFSLLVSLYSSRVILDALGASDYGVYNVVGGVVAMFSIVTSSLSSASSRFLTFELGKGGGRKLRQTFSTSLAIQAVLAVIIILLVESIGLWYLNNRLNIDPNRLYAANWVLHCSVATFVTSLLIVPYNASVIAHEKMSFFAYVSIAEVSLKLIVALFLAYTSFAGDKLIAYAVLLVISTWIIQIIYFVFCRKNFSECHFERITSKATFVEMFSFASWNVFGNAATMLNTQGVNISLNQAFGTTINAARGIATSVNNIVGNFVNNFTMALNPQITKTYASGDLYYLHELVVRGTKFSWYIMILLGVPVLLETDYLIHLWLVEVPEHTINFVRLVLLLSFADILSNVPIMAQVSTGIIKWFRIISSSVLFLNFIFSAILLRRGLVPEITYCVAILVSFCNSIVALLFTRKYISLSIRMFVRRVYLPIVVVSICSLALPLIPLLLMDESFIRLVIVSLASVCTSSLCILFFGCNSEERKFIFSFFFSVLRKFGFLKAERNVA